VQDLLVIDEPATAAAALDATRSQVLAALRTPGSATTVAAALGLTRQQANYHVRALESHGLVALVEERARRGLVERVVQATAEGFVISPAVMGALAPDPQRSDRLSSSYVLALASRTIREIVDLAAAAGRVGKTLPTLAIDTDVCFASPEDRQAFTRELATTVAALAAKYHQESAPAGRWHRLVVAAHPRPVPSQP
jgi:DNA-binding transcriptional ArsR family regulator